MSKELTSAQQHYIKSLAEHKATPATVFGNDQPLPQIITWKKEDTNVYRVDFILWGSTLFVSGDLGCATYCWWRGNNMCWGNFRDMDYGYFFSKCEASEKGSHPHEWDADKAEESVKFRIKELRGELRDPQCWDKEAATVIRTKLKDSEEDIISAVHGTERDWEEFLKDMDTELRNALFSEEWYEYIAIGMVESMRSWMHWQALQMALDQLLGPKKEIVERTPPIAPGPERA